MPSGCRAQRAVPALSTAIPASYSSRSVDEVGATVVASRHHAVADGECAGPDVELFLTESAIPMHP
jgi:hypothetical protein